GRRLTRYRSALGLTRDDEDRAGELRNGIAPRRLRRTRHAAILLLGQRPAGELFLGPCWILLAPPRGDLSDGRRSLAVGLARRATRGGAHAVQLFLVPPSRVFEDGASEHI